MRTRWKSRPRACSKAWPAGWKAIPTCGNASSSLEETRDQRRLIKECIDRRGGGTSVMKDLTGKAMASMQAFSGMFASDEVVKGGMFSYAFEHMEIAAYRNLIEAAKLLGDTATQQVCERILPQEIAMAAWLEQNMAAVTRRFLQRADQPGAQAKR